MTLEIDWRDAFKGIERHYFVYDACRKLAIPIAYYVRTPRPDEKAIQDADVLVAFKVTDLETIMDNIKIPPHTRPFTEDHDTTGA